MENAQNDTERIEIIPLPGAHPTEVVGLVEKLSDHGGREDCYKIASDLQCEFGQIVLIIQFAELLDFVETIKADVVVTSLGELFIKSNLVDRKEILKKQLLKVGTFAQIVKILKNQQENRIDYDEFLDILVMFFPEENPHKMARIIIEWGRFADLFGYNARKKIFFLQDSNI